MGRPKRDILATVVESATPPDELTPSQSLARVVKAEGNSMYTCELPNKKAGLFELQSRFQNTVWIKRGGYVLIDVAPATGEGRASNSRVAGEITNVVRDERQWRKQPYWPKEFVKHTYDDEDEDDSNVGKMPPSDTDEESDS